MSSTHLLFDLPGSCFLRGFTTRNLIVFPIKLTHGRLTSFKPEQLHEVLLCDDLTTASHRGPNVFFSIVFLNTVRVLQSGTSHFNNNYRYFQDKLLLCCGILPQHSKIFNGVFLLIIPETVTLARSGISSLMMVRTDRNM
jgi:hypothetical protein